MLSVMLSNMCGFSFSCSSLYEMSFDVSRVLNFFDGDEICRFMRRNIRLMIQGIYEKCLLNNVNKTDDASEVIVDSVSCFLNKHKEEIEKMYDYQCAIGLWEKLGHGVSKIAFTHPELPNHIIKIPGWKKAYWKNNEDDIVSHFKNVQYAKNLIRQKQYKHIVLPDVRLAQSSRGPFLIEEKFKFIKNNVIENSQEKTDACNELWDFLYESGFCDIELHDDKNAGFLQNSSPNLKIGIYDFDCKNQPKTLFKRLNIDESDSSGKKLPIKLPIGCGYFADFYGGS